MKLHRLKGSAITLMAALIGVGVFQASLHAQKAAAVTITNTTANPVPVSGGVSVTNTPTVDARQSGNWSVGLVGTPTVKLDPTSPLTIDHGAKQWAGFNLVTQEEFYEPPSGKVFVSNFISGRVTIPNVMGMTYLSCSGIGWIFPKTSEPSGSTATTWYFSEYVGERGWPGNLSCTSIAAAPIQFTVLVRGHLVNAQGVSQ